MKQYNRKPKVYSIDIEVSYVPFPSEQKRREAYYTHAKLFLKAKERMLKESYRNKRGRVSPASSF